MPVPGIEEKPMEPGDSLAADANPELIRYMKWREKRRMQPMHSYRRGSSRLIE